jgi:hypothetical protein
MSSVGLEKGRAPGVCTPAAVTGERSEPIKRSESPLHNSTLQQPPVSPAHLVSAFCAPKLRKLQAALAAAERNAEPDQSDDRSPGELLRQDIDTFQRHALLASLAVTRLQTYTRLIAEDAQEAPLTEKIIWSDLFALARNNPRKATAKLDAMERWLTKEYDTAPQTELHDVIRRAA